METHKTDLLGGALNFLMAYHREGEGLLDRIITGDETGVHHYALESKWTSMTWCDPRTKAPKKAKTGKLAGKVMAIVFWDAKGIILNHYVPSGITVNSVYYGKVLYKVKASCGSLTCSSSTITCVRMLLSSHWSFSPRLSGSFSGILHIRRI